MLMPLVLRSEVEHGTSFNVGLVTISNVVVPKYIFQKTFQRFALLCLQLHCTRKQQFTAQIGTVVHCGAMFPTDICQPEVQ